MASGMFPAPRTFINGQHCDTAQIGFISISLLKNRILRHKKDLRLGNFLR